MENETPKGQIDFGTVPGNEQYEPTPWSLEAAKDLRDHMDEMEELARNGEFGFQVLLMSVEGHIQMVHDIRELVEFWIQLHTDPEIVKG